MKKKRYLYLFLIVCLSMLCTACSSSIDPEPVVVPTEGYPFMEVLLPENADLSQTENMTVSDTEEGTVLVNWMEEDKVSWTLDLPITSRYSFYLSASVEGDWNPEIAVEFRDEEGIIINDTVEWVQSTGSWDEYNALEDTLYLPSGTTTVTLYAKDGSGNDYSNGVIQLKELRFVSELEECVPEVEDLIYLNRYPGWWKNADPTVTLSSTDITYLNFPDSDGPMLQIDEFGNQIDTLTPLADRNELEIHNEVINLNLHYDGEKFVDTETGRPALIRCYEPQFMVKPDEDAVRDLNGIWYENGDSEADIWYEITGDENGGTMKRYVRYPDGDVLTSYDGEWSYIAYNQYTFIDHLEMEPTERMSVDDHDLKLVLKENYKVFYEETTGAYRTFIHESMCDTLLKEVNAPAGQFMQGLWVTSSAPNAGDRYMRLYFTPDQFWLTTYERTEEGGISSEGLEQWDGTWRMNSSNRVLLDCTEGQDQFAMISDDGKSLIVSCYDEVFYFDWDALYEAEEMKE